MANSSITAFCASKNVLCVHKDGHTFKYFAVPGLHQQWMSQKLESQNENPRSRESRLGIEGKDTAEFHTWGEHCGSLSQQLSKHTRMEDLISSAVVAEQQATGRSTPSYETWLAEWLCHTGKPSPVIIPVSLDPGPGLQPSSTSRSSTGTC